MIHVPQDISVACRRPSIRKRLRAKWNMGGGVAVDVTDRLISATGVTRTMAPMLGGQRISNLGVTLANADRELSPLAGKDVSVLAQFKYLGSVFTLEQAIWGENTGWHYFPVYSGIVRVADFSPGSVDLTIEDRLTAELRRPLAQQYTIDPASAAGAVVRDLLQNYGSVPAADLDSSGSFAFAEQVQDDLDWTVYGSIPEGTAIGAAAMDVARSGFGQVIVHEDGQIVYLTEFPRDCGDQSYHPDDFPDEINSANAAGFAMAMTDANVISGVATDYQGLKAHYEDATVEADYGIAVAQMRMPYLLWYRCARLAARILQEIAKEPVPVVRFGTHGIGLAIQLGDIITVKDPMNDVSGEYRVMSKAWSPEFVTIEGASEHHVAAYLDKAFGEWGTAQWSAGVAL
jgi:hypothetical protein